MKKEIFIVFQPVPKTNIRRRGESDIVGAFFSEEKAMEVCQLTNERSMHPTLVDMVLLCIDSELPLSCEYCLKRKQFEKVNKKLLIGSTYLKRDKWEKTNKKKGRMNLKSE